MDIAINYFAVVVAAVAANALGALWYSPLLFGKQWVALMGWTPAQMEEAKKKGMGKMYAIQFLASLVSAYVMARFVGVWAANDAAAAWQLAFWAWLGFVAAGSIGAVLWENKSVKLYAINVVYSLVSLTIMAMILALWH